MNDSATLILTNGESVLVDKDVAESLSCKRLTKTKNGYAAFAVKNENGKSRLILLHRLVNKTPAGMLTDHINGNKLDCRRTNLRTATMSQNVANRKAPNVKKTSFFKGVFWRRNRWLACIKKNGVKQWLGSFSKESDAAIAYNNAATRLFGEFSVLNDLGQGSV